MRSSKLKAQRSFKFPTSKSDGTARHPHRSAAVSQETSRGACRTAKRPRTLHAPSTVCTMQLGFAATGSVRLAWRGALELKVGASLSFELEFAICSHDFRRFTKRVVLIALFAVLGLIGLPCLTPSSAEQSLPVNHFHTQRLCKYLCLAVLALGVNLLWGLPGASPWPVPLLCAGTAYALVDAPLSAHRELVSIPKRTSRFYGLPGISCKVSRHRWAPAPLDPVHELWFAVAAVVWVPAVIAFVVGWLGLAAHQGVYFSILSQR